MAKKKIKDLEKTPIANGEVIKVIPSEAEAKSEDELPKKGNVTIETVAGKYFKESKIKQCEVNLAKILINKGAAKLVKPK
jgi:CRISPR/Cas system-associated protein endoribonuclease Cas2